MQQLEELYKEWTNGKTASRIESLSAEGSNRRYYRFYDNNRSVIGVTGTSKEECTAFIQMAQNFERQGLPTPHIYCCHNDGLHYFQEDLGNQTLYNFLKVGRESKGNYNEEEKNMLRKTISLLPRIQMLGAKGLDWSICYPSPSLDKTSILFDLNYFKYNFLKYMKIDFHELKLEVDLQQLAIDLEHGGPQGFMYRDFQARNVMLKDGHPFFIDFQGGRKGPILYDVASFLWQSSAHYPLALRQELFETYLTALSQYISFNEAEMRHLLYKFVLFRLLQVLGAYGFRGLFERKPYFINSIGPALNNLQELLDNHTFDYPYLITILQSLCQQDSVQLHDRKIHFIRGGTTQTATPTVSPYDNQGALTVRVFSFSYKKGIPADASGNGGGYVFDCRSTHNPGRYEPYKPLTGLDQPVIDFLEQDGEILTFLESVYKLADTHVERYMKRGFTDLMFCFGCTGGRHRSVYSAQHLAEHIHHKYGVHVILEHREQEIKQILK